MTSTPRHQCMIYAGSPAQHLPGLAALIAAKLKEGYRCLYLNRPTMVVGIRSYLVAAGLDVDGQTRDGGLVLSSSQAHFLNGGFDAERMLGQLLDAVQQSRNDGYAGLWASGDMSWEFGNEKDFKKLFEYECELEEAFRNQPYLSGVCQYHADSLPAHAVQDALYTHQSIYVNETLSRINPYYIPSRASVRQRPNTSASDLQEMIRDLQLESSFEI